MPRTARMVIPDEQAVYHVMSRTALDKFPIGSVEKDYLLKLIKQFSRLYFTEILGFCLMGNHFHLLVKMVPDTGFSDDDIEKRLKLFYGEDYKMPVGQMPLLRLKLANLSEFIRDIKVTFARYYNRRHNRRGYFWGDRFKSVIVDRGETLVNCLAYIDLNPLRAGIVKQPEKYRWNSIGYHLQTGNKDHFLSTDFGLKEFNVRSEKERIRRYRRYMYEAGSIDRPDKGKVKVIDPRILAKQKNNEITKASRMRYRTRYFTDSGIIGSKEFVSAHYQRFKHLFATKNKKIPKPVKGLSGMYSLKRLSEFL
jgi:REP element-mobilizing transposase RayT/ribosomal protein S30